MPLMLVSTPEDSLVAPLIFVVGNTKERVLHVFTWRWALLLSYLASLFRLTSMFWMFFFLFAIVTTVSLYAYLNFHPLSLPSYPLAPHTPSPISYVLVHCFMSTTCHLFSTKASHYLLLSVYCFIFSLDIAALSICFPRHLTPLFSSSNTLLFFTACSFHAWLGCSLWVPTDVFFF